MEELGLTSAGQLQPWFVSKLANMLESKGKIAIGWDEVLDDADNYDGMPFTRFYADCIGQGISIPWEDLL